MAKHKTSNKKKSTKKITKKASGKRPAQKKAKAKAPQKKQAEHREHEILQSEDAITVPGKILQKRIVYRTNSGYVVEVTYLNERSKREKTLFTVNETGILNINDVEHRVDSIDLTESQKARGKISDPHIEKVAGERTHMSNAIDSVLKISLTGITIVFLISVVIVITSMA